MSGIIAPAIVNYEWTVRQGDPSFLNVSFPFRVKIESIWFTTQQSYGANPYGLFATGANMVDLETTDRVVRLAAFKSKNSKTQHNNYDNPTDLMAVFQDADYSFGNLDETLKPTMWLGNPDDAAGRIGAFATGGYATTAPQLRSTAAAPVDKSRATNPSWTEGEWNTNTYLADAAIMNTDEMLQLFPYAATGDWTDYENDAIVTISVAYTGIHDTEKESATAKTWTAWWND